MNSKLTPRKMRPSEAKPTAPTGKLEMGTRARSLADGTRVGRSWRGERFDC